MLALSCLVLALSVLARPTEHQRDLLGLLGGGGGDSSDASPSTRVVTRPASQSLKPTLATPQWSPTPTRRSDSPEPTLAPTSVLPASADSQPTDHTSKTWQIVGITVVVVLFIATSISCAMFFDRLWRFLRDVLSCTSRPLVSEEFIPDCEKQSWDNTTLSPSPKPESVYTARPRELPWNTDIKDWNTLHRHPSRRNDHLPA